MDLRRHRSDFNFVRVKGSSPPGGGVGSLLPGLCTRYITHKYTREEASMNWSIDARKSIRRANKVMTYIFFLPAYLYNVHCIHFFPPCTAYTTHNTEVLCGCGCVRLSLCARRREIFKWEHFCPGLFVQDGLQHDYAICMRCRPRA